MTTSFNDLKRNSSSSFAELNKQLQKINNPAQDRSSRSDDRFWSCELDKAGNGYATIRFLPAPQGEDVPFVRMWSHGFKGPTGKWYIENSLTTLGQTDPVAELNTRLWNQGEGSRGRKIVTGTGKDDPGSKRKLNFISNIYVISDPKNPENNGKVFLFKYGKKIFDKLNLLMNPTYEDEAPVNPFDFWNGANFKLKIRRVEGFSNFDQSGFETPSQLAPEETLQQIWKQQYSLQELVSPKNFKSYEELLQKLRLTGHLQAGDEPSSGAKNAAKVSLWSEEEEDVAPAPQFKSKPAPTPVAPVADDDDEDFAFFKKLADED